VAERQALEAGHAPEEELLLLTTHGILHLLGFDHAEPEEKEEMFELQRQLLLTFLATRGRQAPEPLVTHPSVVVAVVGTVLAFLDLAAEAAITG
jgi:hypothetical protein